MQGVVPKVGFGGRLLGAVQLRHPPRDCQDYLLPLPPLQIAAGVAEAPVAVGFLVAVGVAVLAFLVGRRLHRHSPWLAVVCVDLFPSRVVVVAAVLAVAAGAVLAVAAVVIVVVVLLLAALVLAVVDDPRSSPTGCAWHG